METLPTHVQRDDRLYGENHTRMADLLAELRVRLDQARQGGGEKYLQRHREQGKLPVRERIDAPARRRTRRSSSSRRSPPASMYDDDAPGAGIVTGIGRVSGREVLIVANDATVKGGTYYPDDGEEAPARAGDRARRTACRASISSIRAARSCRCRPRSFPTAITSAASSSTRRGCRRSASRRSRW